MIEFQRKEDYSLDCLIGNEIVTIRVNYGPGYWYRVVQALREHNPRIKPSDLGETVERLYYSHAPNELLEDPEKMKRFGYFQCPVCKDVYHTHFFVYQNPCDNCRLANEPAVNSPMSPDSYSEYLRKPEASEHATTQDELQEIEDITHKNSQ